MKWIQVVFFACLTSAVFAQTSDFRKITWGMFFSDVQKIEGSSFKLVDDGSALEGEVELFGKKVTLRYSDILGSKLFVTQAMYKVPVDIFPLVISALQKKYQTLSSGKYFTFLKGIADAAPVSLHIMCFENQNTVIFIGYVAGGLLAFQNRNIEYYSKKRLDDLIIRYEKMMKKNAGDL